VEEEEEEEQEAARSSDNADMLFWCSDTVPTFGFSGGPERPLTRCRRSNSINRTVSWYYFNAAACMWDFEVEASSFCCGVGVGADGTTAVLDFGLNWALHLALRRCLSLIIGPLMTEPKKVALRSLFVIRVGTTSAASFLAGPIPSYGGAQSLWSDAQKVEQLWSWGLNASSLS
jgi:hypothetical protein